VVEWVGLGSNGVDELLNSLKSPDDLRDRFPVLVSPRDDVAQGVLIDNGLLAGYVADLAIGVSDSTCEGQDHAGFELRALGTRDRHGVTASILHVSSARPLPGFRVIAPDRGLSLVDINIAAASGAVALRFNGFFFSLCFLHNLPLAVVVAVEVVEILSFLAAALRESRNAEA